MRLLTLFTLLGLSFPVWAGSPAIYERAVRVSADAAYDKLYDALEKNGFYVIFEPDMGRTLSGMADKLGAEYNRNQPLRRYRPRVTLMGLIIPRPIFREK